MKILEHQLEYIEIKAQDYQNETNFLCMALTVFVLSVYDELEVEQFNSIVRKSLTKARGYEIKDNDQGYYSGNNLLLSCVILGRIVSNVQLGKDISNKVKDLSLIIETIFDDKDGIGCIQINGNYVKEFLLSAIIFLEKYLPDVMKTLIFEGISFGAQQTNSLILLDIWWKYLVGKKEYAKLKIVFDKWLNEADGIVWDCELYELHDIAERIISLSKGLGWDNEIIKIQAVLDNSQVGYSGRKDYSLYPPLEWYKSIKPSELNWKETGLLFLNISHYASETGDNRATVHVENAVATSVGYNGAKDIGTFIDIISPVNWSDFTIILDAIIASFEYSQFNEDELLLIWETIVKIADIDHSLTEYNSDNAHRIIYVADLRKAILTYIQHNTFSERLIEKLRTAAPSEYNLNYDSESISFKLPDRWYNVENRNVHANEFLEESKEMSCQEAFYKLNEIVTRKGSYHRWDSVLGFIYKLEEEKESIDGFLEPILNYVLQTRDDYFWEYDGSYILLEHLFPYLLGEQRILLLKEVWIHHIRHKYSDDNIYFLNDDLGRFLYWHNQIISEEDKVLALTKILSIHKLWITAFRKKKFPEYYTVLSKDEDDITWADLCKKLESQMWPILNRI